MVNSKMHNNAEKVRGETCERIRLRTIELGLSKAELSRKSGVSYRLIHDIFKLEANPGGKTVGKLAVVLQVSARWLMTGSAVDLSVREDPAEYSTELQAMALSEGWCAGLCKCIEEKKDAVEVGVNEHNLSLQEALSPAIRLFLKKEMKK